MAITPLPTPPSRQRPDDFANEGDAFLGALPAFGTEANALAVEVQGNADSAAADAATAESAALIAAGAANFKGEYNAGTTYQIGESVSFNGERFIAKTVNLGVTPEDGVNWLLIGGIPAQALKEGQVLTTDGNDLVFSDLASIAQNEIIAFFASDTWVVPKNGIYKIHVVGAGGAGGASSATSSIACSGGGAGGYSEKTVRLVESDSYTITIGSGGSSNGAAGGTTSIVGNNVSITANGGSGGATSTSAGVVAPGGAGGTAAGGDINYTGGAGGDASFTSTSKSAAGGGATNLTGVAYRGGISTISGNAGGAGVGENGGDSNASSSSGVLGGGSGFSLYRPVSNSFTPRGEGRVSYGTANFPQNLTMINSVGVGGGGTNSNIRTAGTSSIYGGAGGNTSTDTAGQTDAAAIGGGGGGKNGAGGVSAGGNGLIFIYRVTA